MADRSRVSNEAIAAAVEQLGALMRTELMALRDQVAQLQHQVGTLTAALAAEGEDEEPIRTLDGDQFPQGARDAARPLD